MNKLNTEKYYNDTFPKTIDILNSSPKYDSKTKEEKKISERNVVLFKPSKEFREFINIKNDA